MFSSINLSIGSLNRFVVRTREKQQQVPNKIIAFFVRDMPPTKECSFKGNNSVLISPLEDNRGNGGKAKDSKASAFFVKESPQSFDCLQSSTEIENKVE